MTVTDKDQKYFEGNSCGTRISLWRQVFLSLEAQEVGFWIRNLTKKASTLWTWTPYRLKDNLRHSLVAYFTTSINQCARTTKATSFAAWIGTCVWMDPEISVKLSSRSLLMVSHLNASWNLVRAMENMPLRSFDISSMRHTLIKATHTSSLSI